VFKKKVDVILYLGVGSTPFALMAKLFNVPSVVHVDGLDWKREKWSPLASAYLQFCEYLAIKLPKIAVTDSDFIRKYYKDKYGKEIDIIRYGTEITKDRNFKALTKYSLKKNEYIFVSGRLVPDNHIDEAISAFIKTGNRKLKLVIVGDNLLETEYKNKLQDLSSGHNNVVYTGFQDRPSYFSLLENCRIYIETKRSGGTHPSLVEASNMAQAVICNNHSSHKEVLGNGAIYYKKGSINDLSKTILRVLGLPAKDIQRMRTERKQIIKEKYNWKVVIAQFEDVLFKAIQ
jgi:glycosyltransferase involved in cell wall biosynthesis